ncbi:DUF1707 SHOCT-like domain-containing protein [Kutzneria kofuensis]|uniref:DUF1707 domain-containing protein n=1 Tax=Kutzneria kofuensis TaxID=103725 RepID=A0A7W9KJL7_9PSEU|nr:DUF1707 domain-containing protein [Kutzneria kofuensis]MBB5893493.1 hypothetical protein [Kutzneria kofuensis]
MNESPDMRIGDTEREQALAALGEHMSAGRLDIDEYGERSARVTTARTRGELVALFADLPDPKPAFGAPAPAPPASAPAPPAKVASAEVSRRTGMKVSMASIAAASWPVGIAVGLFLHQWEFMAVPVLLSWFTGAFLGRGHHGDRDRDRDRGRQERDRWREERHLMRDEMHRRRRELRGRD